MIEFLKIIGLAIIAAVGYGVIFDQITVRICLEYFTVAHPMVFPTTSPTLLALGWGVIATWWAGALLGLLAACSARLGRLPKLSAGELTRPIACSLTAMAVAAAIAGAIGYALATSGKVWLTPPMADLIPTGRQPAFFTAAAAHSASYAAGVIGAAYVCSYAIRRRRTRNKPTA